MGTVSCIALQEETRSVPFLTCGVGFGNKVLFKYLLARLRGSVESTKYVRNQHKEKSARKRETWGRRYGCAIYRSSEWVLWDGLTARCCASMKMMINLSRRGPPMIPLASNAYTHPRTRINNRPARLSIRIVSLNITLNLTKSISFSLSRSIVKVA